MRWKAALAALLFTLGSCKEGEERIDLHDFAERFIPVQQLPPEYLELSNNYDMGESDLFFVAKDSVYTSHRAVERHSWSEGHEFLVGATRLFMARNGNRETPPYLLEHRHLYYRVMSFSARDTAYAVIDLTSVLDY